MKFLRDVYYLYSKHYTRTKSVLMLGIETYSYVVEKTVYIVSASIFFLILLYFDKHHVLSTDASFSGHATVLLSVIRLCIQERKHQSNHCIIKVVDQRPLAINLPLSTCFFSQLLK